MMGFRMESEGEYHFKSTFEGQVGDLISGALSAERSICECGVSDLWKHYIQKHMFLGREEDSAMESLRHDVQVILERTRLIQQRESTQSPSRLRFCFRTLMAVLLSRPRPSRNLYASVRGGILYHLEDILLHLEEENQRTEADNPVPSPYNVAP